MSWVNLYLVSTLLVPAIAGAIAEENYDWSLSLNEGGHYIGLAIGCFLWPISGVLLAFHHWNEFVLANAKTKITQKIHDCGFEQFERNEGENFLVEANESDMKYLVKMYRKGYQAYIKTEYIEAIRNELLSRNMERNLLK